MAAVVTSKSLGVRDENLVRALLARAFDGAFTDEDWEHALGGEHVLVRRRQAIVAHAAVVPRPMTIGDTHHLVGYVEAVATEPAAQRHGFGMSAMRSVGRIIDERYGVGVLSTGAHHFYEQLGWRRWRGPSWVRLTSGETVRTPDEDDGIMVRTTADGSFVDLGDAIVCDERPGDDW